MKEKTKNGECDYTIHYDPFHKRHLTDADNEVYKQFSLCMLEFSRISRDEFNANLNETIVAHAVIVGEIDKARCTLSTIADMASLPRATTERIVKKLTKMNWVRRCDTKPYPTYCWVKNEFPDQDYKLFRSSHHFLLHIKAIAELIERNPQLISRTPEEE
jgi:hypothetical protein